MPELRHPNDFPAKALETETSAELAHLQVNRTCLVEAIRAFQTYFNRWRSGEPADETEGTIRLALFRDGLVQSMACFNKNPAKRREFLIPAEAFDGIEGWEEFYAWMLDLRNCYAAHNVGAKRNSQPVVLIDPRTDEVVGVGSFDVHYQGESLEAEGSIAAFCNTALKHVNARIKEAQARLWAEASALSREERQALPVARNVVPGRNDITTGRDRYRKKTKDFEPPQKD